MLKIQINGESWVLHNDFRLPSNPQKVITLADVKENPENFSQELFELSEFGESPTLQRFVEVTEVAETEKTTKKGGK